ncbi:hypothetical protein [Streptomyces sp. 5-10]|uniref:hypothetical protein n=1 Tax=Streptomyces sp. 5-10 TaxID=878925 RepID=UPI00168BFB1C|nr:hypothetical protein [Streptomyces sp. 5-10]MBD3004706.1 hypothetical protein [Streptomyces sp. 5-10]
MSKEPVTRFGTYDSFGDFLDEFFPDDPMVRERVKRNVECLAAEERSAEVRGGLR